MKCKINPNSDEPLVEKTWDEFREIGLLWWINQLLHIFGWAIVLEINDAGEVVNCYPARTIFRGFDENTNAKGYIAVSNYMKENSETLCEETKG